MQARGPLMLCTEFAIGDELKLKWVQAGWTWGSTHRGHLGRVTEAEVDEIGRSWTLYIEGVLKGWLELRCGTGLEVLGSSV